MKFQVVIVFWLMGILCLDRPAMDDEGMISEVNAK